MAFLAVSWGGAAGVLLSEWIFSHEVVSAGRGVAGPKEWMGLVGAVTVISVLKAKFEVTWRSPQKLYPSKGKTRGDRLSRLSSRTTLEWSYDDV
jgi:hypothetical protein